MMGPQATGIPEGIFWRLAASGHTGHGGSDLGATAEINSGDADDAIFAGELNRWDVGCR